MNLLESTVEHKVNDSRIYVCIIDETAITTFQEYPESENGEM